LIIKLILGNFVIRIISWRHTVAPHGGKLGQHSGC